MNDPVLSPQQLADGVYTTAQLAGMAGVTGNLVNKYARRYGLGIQPSPGSMRLFTKRDVDRFLNRKRTHGPDPGTYTPSPETISKLSGAMLAVHAERRGRWRS